MSELYNIFLYRKDNGRAAGAQLSTLPYDTELYDMTTVPTPPTTKKENEWWTPINWPYWNGEDWELRPIEE